ncbi:MAG: LicD family protein [Clostridia bacterium]|nr:LicD family protein [Clostridia bacterium]
MDNFSQKKLVKIQETEIEILLKIDEICRRHNIQYSLYAGTMLGAIRHKGFIPWDDDIDIAMLRSDYYRFIEIWEMEKPVGYILQNKEKDPKFTQSFTKIRKDHTTFLQYESERGIYHTGIFVDIFPMDRIPDNKIQKFLFFWHCYKYQLYTREFIPPKSNIIVKLIAKLHLSTSKNKIKQRREKLIKVITKYNFNKSYKLVEISTVPTMKHALPADLFDSFIDVEFNGFTFQSVKEYHTWLSSLYGDYMHLPPESERTWTHHPIILDFEHNYEEL